MSTDAKAPPSAKTGAANELIETGKTLAYALALALALRIFLFQPYTIPSASMEPNLYGDSANGSGDYIIVSKYSYGYSKHSIPLSPPLFSGRIFFHAPKRGDIIVFKWPHDGHTDYIKRLIGLPGDRVQLKGGVVYVNGQEFPRQALPTPPDAPDTGAIRFLETNLEGRQYVVNRGPEAEANDTGVYVVPPHCYFMMGDNRDNSLDSRFDPYMPPTAKGSATCGWDASLDRYIVPEPQAGVGFVPEENLVGRAQFILLSWKEGTSLYKPWTWVLNLRLGRMFHGLK